MRSNFFCHNEFIDNRLGRERTDSSSETISHHHKESLCRRTLCFFCLLIDVERTGDIEEIKGKTIDDAAQDEEDDSRETGITCSKECKAEYPREHRHKHDVLDSEAFEEERNSQDTERLADLADGDKDIRVLHTKGVSKLFDCAKRGDEGVCITIRHLQTHSEHHREDEEERHLLLFEERKGLQAKRLYEIDRSFCFLNLTSRKRERICG